MPDTNTAQWPQAITSPQECRAWFDTLLRINGLNFHCDEPAAAYISRETGQPVFTPAAAARFDLLMVQCFEVCDPYAVGCEAFSAFLA